MSPDHGHPDTLRLVTFNCWGLKYISKHRNARLTEIGRRIANLQPPADIIGLQECWTQEDYQSIRHETRHVLPYGKFYYSGVFGSGLAILSRWPIEESSMVRYTLNGRPTAFFRGDWFVGKGVACARIRMGPGPESVAEIFCTHLHAPYEREPNDSYICHRTAQAWEFAKLIRGAAERGHTVIGLGDFNMVPLSLAHRLISAHSPVHDIWRVLHPDSSLGAAIEGDELGQQRPMPTVDFNLIENGTTCDSPLNTWRWSKEQQKRLERGDDIVVDGNTRDPHGKRLDYIFFGNGLRSDENNTMSLSNRHWLVHDVKVGMLARHPSLRCSLSDHFSVEATLQRGSQVSEQAYRADPLTEKSADVYDSNIEPKEGRKAHVSPLPLIRYLKASDYDDILAMITAYRAREYRQRRLRLLHFVSSVVISAGCLIAVWWSPHNYVSFVLMLVSSLGLSAGVIDGLIGGLFVGSELRALKEFESEVLDARTASRNKSK